MQNSLAMSRSKENLTNDIVNVPATRQGASTEVFDSAEGGEIIVKSENYIEEGMDLKTDFPQDSRGRRKVVQESRDEDGCHGDSGLLNMLAEVASATLHNDTLARRTTRNPRGRPRKQSVADVPLNPATEPADSSDSNKLNLAQIQLLTEKQLVDLFAIMDSDEIRRTFSYSCRLLQRCQFTANSFGSEMKARQEMQRHLSQHVRDLMRKARESPEFRFSAAPVVSKAKKLTASTAASSAAREARTPPSNKAKDKIKIKLAPASSTSTRKVTATPKSNSRLTTPRRKAAEVPAAKANSTSKAVRSKVKEEPVARKETTTKRKRGVTVAAPVASTDDEELSPEMDVPNSEETTVKDKWLKLYHEKFRAADEARFRAIQAEMSAESDGDHEYGAVAEEVVVTSEETTSTVAAGSSGNSLPDHDYNIYRFSKKSSAGAAAPSEVRNQDEQMEAVAQSVAAAAQEKEKLKRKRTQQAPSGVPLHSFMLEETTKQSKVVVKNKPTEPLPCVGSEVVVGYNPNEFYLMKSADLPVIEDLRQKSGNSSAAPAVTSTTGPSSASGSGTQQFMFVCMTEDGELIEETVQEQEMYLEDEEQLLEQVAAQATVRHVPEKDMVDIARKRAKIKPKFVSQSAAERELALQYISELKQQRGSGVDSLHCKICTPVRTFTAPTTLLSHYRSHAGIKPYECRRCGAVFTRQHSLNYHMLIHANLSRFTCPDCHRQFRHPSHYKEHRRRHTGEAPYECSDCMQRFRTRNSYKRHLMTRHGKLLTSTGGLIILPEEEFNKVRCKPRPMRSGRPADSASASAPTVTKINKESSASGSTSSTSATPSKGSTKAAKNKIPAAGTDADGSGNFEQQRQEDLIRLLYQRLTSPNEHSSAESGSGSSRSNSPVPVLMPSELDDETQVVEQVVVESPEVAAAVVVESIPSSQEVVEEQCEVVTDETWGSSYISLTVDGQNNVIFLDESQATDAAVTTGASVVIEESKPVSTVERKSTKTNRGRAAASVSTALPAAASSSSNENNVDLLSFVHNAGVMVQHILDIQSDNSTP